ncbi:hypothetical protein ONZ45_g10498 [Pleurotus djamor]|nr:hypothetical protein ONZ45_g17627 [Pleurotus djamor]KAJ8507093.1 hypothetical protein ONZ45_g10498 [Pleurotus djamor]
MARSAVFVLVAYIACLVCAAPILSSALQRREFVLQDYAAFQISDGVAGDAKAKAEAVFVAPFEGVDLATVSDATQKDVETMRKLAETAETSQFNPAIDAASGDEADALQRGKIQNKVLKLTGITQVLKIKLAKAQAKGDDTASIEEKIEAEIKKLNKNIDTDVKSAGLASKGVA